MSDTIVGAIIGVVGTLLVAIVTWYFMAQANATARQVLEQQIAAERRQASEQRQRADRERARADRLQASINEASTRYPTNMDQLFAEVRKELDRREGPSQLVPAARALLTARDEFRAVFAEIGVLLNSDFDRLGNELTGSAAADPTRLRETLETLERSWPAKKNALQIAIKKAMAALGLG